MQSLSSICMVLRRCSSAKIVTLIIQSIAIFVVSQWEPCQQVMHVQILAITASATTVCRSVKPSRFRLVRVPFVSKYKRAISVIDNGDFSLGKRDFHHGILLRSAVERSV